LNNFTKITRTVLRVAPLHNMINPDAMSTLSMRVPGKHFVFTQALSNWTLNSAKQNMCTHKKLFSQVGYKLRFEAFSTNYLATATSW